MRFCTSEVEGWRSKCVAETVIVEQRRRHGAWAGVLAVTHG